MAVRNAIVQSTLLQSKPSLGREDRGMGKVCGKERLCGGQKCEPTRLCARTRTERRRLDGGFKMLAGQTRPEACSFHHGGATTRRQEWVKGEGRYSAYSVRGTALVRSTVSSRPPTPHCLVVGSSRWGPSPPAHPPSPGRCVCPRQNYHYPYAPKACLLVPSTLGTRVLW